MAFNGFTLADDEENAKEFFRTRLSDQRRLSRAATSFTRSCILSLVRQALSHGMTYSGIRRLISSLEDRKNSVFYLNGIIITFSSRIKKMLTEAAYSRIAALCDEEDDEEEKRLRSLATDVIGSPHGVYELDNSLSDYSRRVGLEAELVALSALSSGKSYESVKKELSNEDTFIDSPIIKEEKDKNAFIALRLGEYLKDDERKYAFNDVSKAVAAAVSFWYALAVDAAYVSSFGTQFYLVKRGSSYPCALCDSMRGIHSGWDELPPYHKNCCCIAIPVTLNLIYDE